MIANPIPWPNGCRCAVAITFDMDADSILHLAHPDSADNRVMALSMLRYGPEIAIPRILEMYRRFAMKQTFFIPAWTMERYPAAVEAILKDGHESGHLGYLLEHPNELSREDELYWMQRSIAVIEKMTGQRPRGNRAPSYRFSRNSLDHLVGEGFAYDASLIDPEADREMNWVIELIETIRSSRAQMGVPVGLKLPMVLAEAEAPARAALARYAS